MKAARTGQEAESVGIDVVDDRKLCPNCKRKFNEIAAERHIHLCAAKHRAKGIKI